MKAETIYNYSSYRTFLKDFNLYKKEKNPFWGLGVWAQKAGLSSKSTLSMILNGRRHPGKDVSEKLTRYFKFNDREKSYFQDLIRLEKNQDDPHLSLIIMERLKRGNPQKSFLLLDDKTFSSIANWYYYAIREMVNLPDFKEDASWIKEKLNFKVSETQINEALKTLLDIGLLKRDHAKSLLQSQADVSTPDHIAKEAIKRNHEDNLNNALLALRKMGPQDRYFSSITFNMNPANIEKFQTLIRDFEDRACEIFEENVDASTFQFNINFFPLTKLEQQLENKV
jgi:uncharacterized protein (TIGR02147 family)